MPPDEPNSQKINEELTKRFIEFSIKQKALNFGEFHTKAGRLSPYFFNIGNFNTGALLSQLANFYSQKLIAAISAGIKFDMLMGPAYKGIPLVCSTAMALAGEGHSIPFAFNRKELKDHGEGGLWIGAPLQGRILVVDDVMSTGLSIQEVAEQIHQHGATLAGVIVSLDREERITLSPSQEKTDNNRERPSLTDTKTSKIAPASVPFPESGMSLKTAAQVLSDKYNIPVLSLASLTDLLKWLKESDEKTLSLHATAVSAYRQRYGSKMPLP